MTSTTSKRLREITDVAKELPENELKELLDFAQFLRVRKQGFSYKGVADSVQYVQDLRTKAGAGSRSGEVSVRELIEWQDSNS